MRKQKSWRYLAVLLLLLALAIWGTREGMADGLARTAEEAALSGGLQLKTVVTFGDASFTDSDGVLKSILKNSKLVFLREHPDEAGRLLSADWQLQDASVLDWTGMLADGSLLEQSNLFFGSTIRTAAPQSNLSAVWSNWKASALTETQEPLADMTARIVVLTQPETVGLVSALCAELTENDALWLQESLLLASEGGEAALETFSALRAKIAAVPARVDEALGAEDALIWCVDEDAQGNVLLRQMDVSSQAGSFHSEWTLTEDGRLSFLNGEGVLSGKPLFITAQIDYTAMNGGAREDISGEIDVRYGDDALSLAWSDSASGAMKNYMRKTTLTVQVTRGDVEAASVSLQAKTTAAKESARIDTAEGIIDWDALDRAGKQAQFEQMQQGVVQAVFTILGRMPKDAAAALLEKMN